MTSPRDNDVSEAMTADRRSPDARLASSPSRAVLAQRYAKRPESIPELMAQVDP